MSLSRSTQRAARAYGVTACLDAYAMHSKRGEGASTIAFTGPASIKTTRQADAAINAGREIRTAVLREYLVTIEYDPSKVSCLPAYSRCNFDNDIELRLRAAV